MSKGDGNYAPAIIAAIVIVIVLALAAWAAVTHWGMVPLLEAATGNNIPFWPTYLSTLAIAGLFGARIEREGTSDR